MKTIYFDNASTSFPKAPGLGKVMCEFIENNATNIGRGGGENTANELVFRTRTRLAEFFDAKTENVIFTSGATASANMLLKGLLKKGDCVVTGSLEHHAVMRTLKQLDGVEHRTVKADKEGNIDISEFEKTISPDTKLVLINHASNVCGTIAPIEEIGKLCKNKGIYFAIDAAQTAGIIDISVKKNNIDFLIFAGHKGLMGPQGVGGFVISDRLAGELKPYMGGGTGSYSDIYEMPPELPDRFEAGTLNIPGIVGLGHSLEYIMNEGTDKIFAHERELTSYFLDRIKDLPLRIIGRDDVNNRVGVVSVVAMFSDNGVLASRLEDNKIAIRYGLHCAPMAHETLGTYETGTVRFSFGYFNTKAEIDKTVEILRGLLIG